jgi:hypothetical protein
MADALRFGEVEQTLTRLFDRVDQVNSSFTTSL